MEQHKHTSEALEEELRVQREENAALKAHYEGVVANLHEELAYVKEQMDAQRTMLEDALNYTNTLVKELTSLRTNVEKAKTV